MPSPVPFLLMLMAGWVNRRQLEAIDYLKEENRVLCEQLGVRRLRFTDDERRRLSSQLLEQPENRRARRRQAKLAPLRGRVARP